MHTICTWRCCLIDAKISLVPKHQLIVPSTLLAPATNIWTYKATKPQRYIRSLHWHMSYFFKIAQKGKERKKNDKSELTRQLTWIMCCVYSPGLFLMFIILSFFFFYRDETFSVMWLVLLWFHFSTVMEHFLPWYHFTTVIEHFLPWYHFTAVMWHFIRWYH